MDGAPQCIWLNDDGSYGYDFDASSTGGGINYPEVFVGTRPWGDDTGVAEFPVRRRNVDQLELTVDVDVNVSGGEWDLAEEWWLCEEDPTVNPETHTHEIMLVLDWGGGHSHDMVERNVWTDEFGNQIDYWANYSEGGTSADFHIFRVNGGMQSGSVDLSEIVDFMSERYGTSGDLFLSGIELGNEYWTGAQGEVTYNQFDVTVNGRTYTSGDGTDSGGSAGGGSSDDGSSGDGDSSDDDSSDDDSSDAGSGSTDDGSSDGGGDGSGYPTWDPSATYRSGDRVSWDGRVWEAQWWTQDQEPRVEDYYVWQSVSDAGSGSDDGSTDDGSSSDGGSTDDGSSSDGGDSTDDGSSNDGSTDDGSSSDGSDSTDDGSTDTGSASDDPLAELAPSTTSASVGERVVFRVTDTSGAGRWIDSIDVEFGDGAGGSGWWNAHAYDSPGTYTAALHATDNEGTTTTHEVTVTVA